MSGTLSERFDDALLYASRLHRGQVRKGTAVPYLAHLLAVAALVLDHGGDEDEAIAALLHDAVEDQGGPPVLAEIERRFGPRAAAIVAGCTDADGTPRPPWRARKDACLAHLRTAPAPVILVSAADKLHNAQAILADYRRLGEPLWDRFSGGRRGVLWYYRALVAAYRETGHAGALVVELDRVVSRIERLAQGGPHEPTATA